MKEDIWLIIGDAICLLTAIVMLVTSTTSQETIIGGILAGLSWIGALWIGLYKGEKMAKKEEEEQS